MGEHDQIFGSISRAKAVGGFASRLGIGTHIVALKRFGVKISQKDNKGTPILEADFTVLESSVHPAGETRGWAWFIGSQGFAGSYEEARAKDFLSTVGKCIGDTRDTSLIGSDLAAAAQPGRGLALRIEVTAQTNRDGSPKQNAKGETYTNAAWTAIPQDGAAIAAMRAQLDKMESAVPVSAPAPVATPAPAPPQGFGGGFGQPQQPQGPAPTPASAGGFGNLLAGLKR